MTQPVQEPSDQRQISGLDYRTRQLARRPAPVVSADAPWARVQKTIGSTVQNIPNNSITSVEMTEYVNIGAGESGEGFFTEDSNSPQTDLVPLVQGIYLVKILVYWNVTNVGPFRFGISRNHGSVIPEHEMFYGNTGHTGINESQEFFATSLQHIEGQNTPLSIILHHRAGADRGLDSAFLHAVKIADYSGTDWDDGILDPPSP